MRSKHWVIVTVLLLVNPAVTFAQAAPPPGTATIAVRNGDVLSRMLTGGS